MMTFKQFYLQTSKGDKAPLREPRSFKDSKAAGREIGSGHEAQGSKGSFWAIGHGLIDMRLMKARSFAASYRSVSRRERACPKLPADNAPKNSLTRQYFCS